MAHYIPVISTRLMHIPQPHEVTPRNRLCQRIALLGLFGGLAILAASYGTARPLIPRSWALGIGWPLAAVSALFWKALLGIDYLNKHRNTRLFETVDNFENEAPNPWKKRMIKGLLWLGANPNAKNTYNTTPLHSAHDIDIVKQLLEMGADPKAKDGFNRTPLHSFKDSEVIRLLIAHGAEIDVQDEDGSTPLHIAVSIYRKKNVEVLLELNADFRLKDKQSQTPLDLARKRKEDLEKEPVTCLNQIYMDELNGIIPLLEKQTEDGSL